MFLLKTTGLVAGIGRGGMEVPQLITIAALNDCMSLDLDTLMKHGEAECHEIWALPDDVRQILNHFSYATKVYWMALQGMRITAEKLFILGSPANGITDELKHSEIAGVFGKRIIVFVWWTGFCISE